LSSASHDALAPNAASAPRVSAQAVIPRATYRLQLHRGFDFDAAVAVLPYLDRLGISHIYCSPITRARSGSLHGYDVIDHREISPDLGGRAGFERLSTAARALGIGLLLDMVPNHMGVLGGDNPWWIDILESGRASPFANYFDIDWDPPNPQLRDKVLLPVLGSSYGETLDSGELKVGINAGSGTITIVAYGEHRFPLDPATWPVVLAKAATLTSDSQARARIEALSNEVAALPTRDDLHRLGDRAVGVKTIKQRLAELLQSDSAAATALATAAEQLNDAAGRDELHALLEAQAYRLAHWRVAADEINYRRFFDINELAALRMEDEQVFEATQGPTLELTAAGLADGLRIDHPDGLRDPAQYFERLQQGHAQRAGLTLPTASQATRSDARPLYVLIEKIAASHEDVPPEWAVHGTTGYRFANVVNGLFVDRRQAARFERIWRNFSGRTESFDEIVHEARREAATGALGSELTVLANMLRRVAAADRRWRDQGFETLRNAIAEVAACMPVYRTYVVDKPSVQDLRYIDWGIAHARQRSLIADLTVFDFMRQCMRAEASPDDAGGISDQLRKFAWRFQQYCAPVAAKGVEDTAFYRYHRLISLNDVGGDPAAFGVTITAFHGASADRAARWPHTMLATSTHDNKRSEDVRNRIDVLCEATAVWRMGLRRWHMMTRSFRKEINGYEAPSAADEMLLYQTILGSLPVVDDIDEAALNTYRERIEAYMLKAAREAKRETSWVRPNEPYESALTGFVRSVLGRLTKNPVLSDLRARADELAWFGALNSVSMALLKFTSPGVPDLYQGNEIIDLSLVDPDNRRPVDYELRSRWLDELSAVTADDLNRAATLRKFAALPADGRLKMWTTWRLLELRRRHPDLFRDGGYTPLRVRGAEREHVVAFARRTSGVLLIVVAGRLFATLLGQARAPATGEACWQDTVVDVSTLLPSASQGSRTLNAVNVLTGTAITIEGGELRMSDAFSDIPAAAFEIALE
jgi:(1->4)-alpha-D-glucan 1-alpha-D-glucosylmutase